MNKKTIIAIVLCIAVWLLWSALFVEPPPKKPVGGRADGGVTVTQKDKTATKEKDTEAEKDAEKEPPDERPDERIAQVKTKLFEAEWSTRGASLKAFKLNDYTERDEEGKKGKRQKENLVSTEKEEYRPFSIRFRAEKTDFKLPRYTDWALVEEAKDHIVFRYSDPENVETPVITKTYTKGEQRYVFDLKVELQNRSESSITEQIILDTFASYERIQSSGPESRRSCGPASTSSISWLPPWPWGWTRPYARSRRGTREY
jgi:YidC/Oxa1 family membrane protein insertase